MKIADKEKLALAQSALKIQPHDLIAYLKHYAAALTTLSLDCFDTLLWRQTVTPVDVFYLLQQMPVFKSLGLTAESRVIAETKARQSKKILEPAQLEVTLNDIYQASLLNLSSEQIAELNNEELHCEMQMCYAFPPVVELIRAAHQLGKNIIIVSDTYFTEKQLRALLQHCLPQDAYNAINKVFCSSEHGNSKVNGLFCIVSKEIKHAPEAILHIGDNIEADYVAARLENMTALHLLHENETITNLLRLRTIAAQVMDPAIRISKPLLSPFRGVLATSAGSIEKPETLIGCASLGPLMYAFAQFILQQINQIQAKGKKPKVLFLMRDAHLPKLACETLLGESMGQSVYISRFAAFAATFRTEEDVKRYLLNYVNSDRLPDIARQLLLPEKVAEPIIKVAERETQSAHAFVKQILRKDILRIIFAKSAEYRERLLQHLNTDKQLKLTAGDTLVFVDLGYTGTVQQQLTPLFNELGIDVFGCYLIAFRTQERGTSRCGLIDSSCIDENAMQMLVAYIALLEQLCTSPESSVVDYEKNGKPIFSDTSIQTQHNKLRLIQQECLRFIFKAKQFFHSTNIELSQATLSATAIAELARMLFLPSKNELHYLQSFYFDLNLGTSDVLKLFDPELGLTGMRRRGLNFMERNLKIMRTNYPAELRSIGFEFVMLLMLQNRYKIDIKQEDMLQRTLSLNCILSRGHETHSVQIDAMNTHDGFYSAWLPVGKGDIDVAMLLGEKFQWLQIESAELIQIDAFAKQKEAENCLDAWSTLSFIGMREEGGDKNGRLFACGMSSSQLVVRPRMVQGSGMEFVFRLVFRPVVMREMGKEAVGIGLKIS